MPEQVTFDAQDEKLIHFLSTLHIFREVAKEEIASLAPLMEKYLYHPNETVFAEGEMGDRIYFIEQGHCIIDKMGRVIKTLGRGEMFGEVSMIDNRPHTATVRASQTTVLLCIKEEHLQCGKALSGETIVKMYKALGRMLTSYIREEDTLYRELDALIIQDGGCAPGYNPVTAFVTQYLEQTGRQVFVAKEGFKSIVNGDAKDFHCLVHSKTLYKSLEKVRGVLFAPPLREARGANFRTERYKEFKNIELQKKAAQNLIARKVKVVVGIGGNGTFAGIKSLSQYLPEETQVFFIPVTIDSDIYGSECIGEHTGVEVGAEKIRCYMADARTHHRCYIIEMMGADGGYHALHSCLGAGAHLAVMPCSEYHIDRIVHAMKDREYTVIVVAEGYKKDERKQRNFGGNAAEFFRDELISAGLQTSQRIICESFSRDIRGALPNNMDITLAQRMARKLSELVLSKQTFMMPAVLSGKEYSIRFDQIRTDNFVESDLAILANRLV